VRPHHLPGRHVSKLAVVTRLQDLPWSHDPTSFLTLVRFHDGARPKAPAVMWAAVVIAGVALLVLVPVLSSGVGHVVEVPSPPLLLAVPPPPLVLPPQPLPPPTTTTVTITVSAAAASISGRGGCGGALIGSSCAFIGDSGGALLSGVGGGGGGSGV